MTIREILQRDQPRLKKISPTYALDIDVLLAHVLNKPKSFVISHPDFELAPSVQRKYDQLIEQRLHYKPVALLIGKKEFFNVSLAVNENTFIPRPETELIIEYCLKFFPEIDYDLPKVLDLGTGPGTIPIALAKNHPRARYEGVDISKKAIITARNNAESNRVEIKFFHSDLFSAVQGNYDIITANLPYVPIDIYEQNKFLRHEPKEAITDGGDGLSLIRRTLAGLPQHLEKQGIALFEIHFTQVEPIRALSIGQGLKIKDILSDIQGFPRIIVLSF